MNGKIHKSFFRRLDADTLDQASTESVTQTGILPQLVNFFVTDLKNQRP
jgi:hypothetical protein